MACHRLAQKYLANIKDKFIIYKRNIYICKNARGRHEIY